MSLTSAKTISANGNAIIPAKLLGGATNVTVQIAATLNYPIAA